jgi:hypothetical protein
MTSVPYVFISHSSKNNALARRLTADLAEAGLSGWLDVEAIRDGDRWVSQIQAAIEDCSAVVLLHTRAARTSEWVEREILLALEHNKPIFIARCDDVPLPLPLITRQFTDFTTYSLGIKRLIEILHDLISKPPLLKKAVVTDTLTDEERFFVYLEQLPNGSLAAMVAGDLYRWANTWAEDLIFRGQHAPSLYVQHQMGARAVTLFAIRGYVQNPAVQISFDHLMRYAPSLCLHLRDYQERLAVFQPSLPDDPAAIEASRRPNIPLVALDTAEKLETLKILIDELRTHLNAAP